MISVVGTSTKPIIVETDAGRAYCKVMGNPEGPHVLLCDLIGTRLAAWLGVTTPECAVLEFPVQLLTELTEKHTAIAAPAFLTRALDDAFPWGGDADELDSIENVDELAGFVVLDTWLRNCDRYCVRLEQVRCNLGNVLLSGDGLRPGRLRAVAIDHGCVLTCGRYLKPSDLKIAAVRDEVLYGLFPGFVEHVRRPAAARYIDRLRSFKETDAAACLDGAPAAWDFTPELREVIAEFLLDRARFVVPWLERSLEEDCGWPSTLPMKEPA